ncbi:hypothetical protein J9A43_25035 [Klebsiella pneumoniae]|nr:hypothetical protein [Klebsiella pneumoniae subsp. pneumoniae]HCU0383264.1 hypothetical protein [Klebsiella pneumoniae]
MNNDGLTLNQLAERNAALVTKVEKLRAERDQLAAENVALKEAIPQLKNIDYQNENMDDVALAEEIGFNAAVMAMHRWVPKTPATDRIVAGIKADGVEEFASYISLYNSNAERHAIDFSKQLRDGVNHD